MVLLPQTSEGSIILDTAYIGIPEILGSDICHVHSLYDYSEETIRLVDDTYIHFWLGVSSGGGSGVSDSQ